MSRKTRARPAPARSFRQLATLRLHILAGRSERYAERSYRALFGLSLPECRVIGIIGNIERTSFRTICRDANLEKSYASRIINRLVERGFVEKIGDPADQRAVMLSLTAAGVGLHDELVEAAGALNQQLVRVLTPEQQRTLMTCILLLSERLTEIEKHGDVRTMPPLPEGEPASEPAPAQAPALQIGLDAARELHRLLGAALDRQAGAEANGAR